MWNFLLIKRRAISTIFIRHPIDSIFFFAHSRLYIRNTPWKPLTRKRMYDLLVARETPKTCPKGEDGKKLERSSLNKRITAWKQKRGDDPWATHTPTCPYLVHPWRVLIAFKFPADAARTGVRPVRVTTARKNGNGGGQEGNSRKKGSRDL